VYENEEFMKLRTILPNDNLEIASIIRSSLKSYGLDIPGTVYTDPTTDDLYSLFSTDDSIYYIAEDQDRILGGCGIYPTKGLPQGHVELVKLYIRDDVKGKGLGRLLMEESIKWAKDRGHTHIYLETLNELASAVGLYQKLGFEKLSSPLGDSGHHACDIWMIKAI
jgi:putative acetyltransferase